MLHKNIVSSIPTPQAFQELLEENPGLVIIKFSATWCAPCQRIKPLVDRFFASSPDTVVCCDIDVDACRELYSYLKRRRMLDGVPSILCYRRGNPHTQAIPDDSVVGSDLVALDSFFHRCGSYVVPPAASSASSSPIRRSQSAAATATSSPRAWGSRA